MWFGKSLFGGISQVLQSPILVRSVLGTASVLGRVLRLSRAAATAFRCEGESCHPPILSGRSGKVHQTASPPRDACLNIQLNIRTNLIYRLITWNGDLTKLTGVYEPRRDLFTVFHPGVGSHRRCKRRVYLSTHTFTSLIGGL